MVQARPARLLALACAAAPLAAAKPPAINTSPITWTGAAGHVIHGYMAIPAKARGPQPAVLVLADGAVGGQAAAHGLVDMLARTGFLACTARGDEPDADLRASFDWLRTNSYATGRVALVALGPAAAARAVALPDARALLILDVAPTAPDVVAVPMLSIDPPAAGAELPPAAAAFLKEHLR